MQRLISLPDAAFPWLAAGSRAACLAALVTLITKSASAIGLTYVDGDNGANGVINLAPLSSISFSDDPANMNDGIWSYRNDGGAANPGDFIKSVYEASGGTMPEDVPEISQTVSGLGASTSYDMYVVYWQGALSGHNWTVRAGFTSGNLTLFNAQGPNATYPSAVAGTTALHHDWELAAMPWNPTDNKPLFFEDGRTLLLAHVGTTISSPGGQIEVFIDDLPTTGGPDSGSSGARTWFEGVAYAPAGTAVYRPPGDFNGMNGVDDDDALEFLSNLHTDISSLNVLEAYQSGDLNADFLINHTDFVMFKELYEADNGSGSFAQFMAGVPEPSSFALLAIGCLFIGTIVSPGRRHRLQFAFHRVNTINRAQKIIGGCILAGSLIGEVNAAPVENWFAIHPSNGSPSGNPTSNLDTSSPIFGDGSANSADQMAMWADIADPLDAAADVSLANGLRITLSGSATFTGITSGNEQFRFGLFNDNSPSPFNEFGWGGYMASQSANNNGGNLRAKDYDAATTFAQTGDAVSIQQVRDGDPFTDGVYEFSMSISRFENDLSIDALLSNGTTFTQEWKSAIVSAPHPVIFDFNRVGFLAGGALNADQIAFQDIDVSVDAAEALTLEVFTAGPNAGQVKLRNKSATSFDIEYYEITSATGSLNFGSWISLDDQEGDDPELQGWNEVPASNANLVSEVMLEPNSFTQMTPSSIFNLGNAFNIGGAEDLKFWFGLTDGTLARGIVDYLQSTALIGDHNGDETVDAADYVLWRSNPSAYDGSQGYTDWVNNFGQTSGSAPSVASSPVPEPATVSMILAIVLTMLICRRTAIVA